MNGCSKKRKKRKADVDWQRGMNGEEVEMCLRFMRVLICPELHSLVSSAAVVAMGILEK